MTTDIVPSTPLETTSEAPPASSETPLSLELVAALQDVAAAAAQVKLWDPLKATLWLPGLQGALTRLEAVQRGGRWSAPPADGHDVPGGGPAVQRAELLRGMHDDRRLLRDRVQRAEEALLQIAEVEDPAIGRDIARAYLSTAAGQRLP
jgi:hypothetical protein